ncbi:MAG: hypothetical protein M0R46_13340 [Candidatus Muirbacterium halophilum]|nr:hypothetical protein [Candidatus Muirbacterium halophilum]MCK9476905.1 hypothetical protein [Candidatus Muirbacterium halophilum]
MFKKLSIITIMILVLSFVSNAYVSNYEVSRNISDMQRLIDFNGIWANQHELNRLADNSLHILRHPVSNNEYRYANWEKRYNSDSRMTVMNVEYGENRFQTISNRFEHIYSVQIEVPKKWGLFHGNDPIYVRSMYISYKDLKGQNKSLNYAVNRWFNVKDEQTFELGIIALSADVTIEAACQNGEKKDCALYINAKKAELVDSFANPNYSAVENFKKFKKEMNSMSKDEALNLLANIDREFGGSFYNPTFGSDYELIEQLRDVKWELPSSVYEASSKLRRIIRVLKDENYDKAVIRELENIDYILSKNQYDSGREAEERLNRIIDRLENGYYNNNSNDNFNTTDVKAALSRIENLLPYQTANALRYTRKLRADVNDTKVTRILDRVINLLETNNSADARQAKDLVNRLINTLNETGYGSYTPAPNYYNLRGELNSLKSLLPYNSSAAQRKIREIKREVESGNFNDTIKRGIERIELLIQKGDYSSCDQAKQMIDRVISQL